MKTSQCRKIPVPDEQDSLLEGIRIIGMGQDVAVIEHIDPNLPIMSTPFLIEIRKPLLSYNALHTSSAYFSAAP